MRRGALKARVDKITELAEKNVPTFSKEEREAIMARVDRLVEHGGLERMASLPPDPRMKSMTNDELFQRIALEIDHWEQELGIA